jgi:hypothetical protein
MRKWVEGGREFIFEVLIRVSFSTVYSGEWKSAKVAIKKLKLDGNNENIRKSILKEMTVLRFVNINVAKILTYISVH